MNERPDTEQIKAQLAAEIVRLIGERKLTATEASRQAGVSEDDLARLRAARLGPFSIDLLIDILNRFRQRVGVYVAPALASHARDGRRSIWEKIAGITASVPAEEWERLPSDLAQNLDHYLYGAKKSD